VFNRKRQELGNRPNAPLSPGKSEWYLLFVLLLLSFVPCVAGVFRLVELTGGAAALPQNPRVHSAPVVFAFHILSSVLFCIVGAFQFLPSVRNRYPGWHWLAGRVVIASGMVTALSGVWMTHCFNYTDGLQGDLLYLVRILVGFAMFAAILLGLRAILRRHIVQHRAWMIRAYALSQGAGTQVLISIPWSLTFGEPYELSRDLMMSTAWGINIIVAELLIFRSSSRRSRQVLNASTRKS